jgi:hypothetical protein
MHGPDAQQFRLALESVREEIVGRLQPSSTCATSFAASSGSI